MKPQSTAPQVLQQLVLVQHGTIGSHQHVIARVQPFKSSVVLLLQCAIENVRVDTQYLLCRHAISSCPSPKLRPTLKSTACAEACNIVTGVKLYPSFGEAQLSIGI